MADPTVEDVRAALARHAAPNGEVFPSALKRIAVEEDWSGRLWEVLRLLATDIDTMRFEAGGDRADEIAECAARWAESSLALPDIEAVLACGGYDPDPFVVLAGAGLLHAALRNDDGSERRVNGERAGMWISDELALSSPADIIERSRRMIADSGPEPASPGSSTAERR